MKTTSFLCALLLLFAASLTLAADPSPIPTRFSARIGGFLGASYSVDLKEGKLLYKSSEAGRRNPKEATITPTAAQWQEFRKELDDLKVWQWTDLYQNRNVLDGTQWSFDIAYADHDLKSGGSNSYPDASGKAHNDPVPTKGFDRYLAALRKLIGDRDFH